MQTTDVVRTLGVLSGTRREAELSEGSRLVRRGFKNYLGRVVRHRSLVVRKGSLFGSWSSLYLLWSCVKFLD